MYQQQQPIYQQVLPPDPGKGMAIAGFVLGLLSVIFMLCSIAPGLAIPVVILAVLGLVFSLLGLKSRTAHGLAIAGFVLSLIAVAIVGVIALSLFSLFTHL